MYKWIPPAEYWGGKTVDDPDGKTVAELEAELNGQSAEERAQNPILMWTTALSTEAGVQYDCYPAKGYSMAQEGDQAVEGALFTRNSGWLLIIPQESRHPDALFHHQEGRRDRLQGGAAQADRNLNRP